MGLGKTLMTSFNSPLGMGAEHQRAEVPAEPPHVRKLGPPEHESCFSQRSKVVVLPDCWGTHGGPSFKAGSDLCQRVPTGRHGWEALTRRTGITSGRHAECKTHGRVRKDQNVHKEI